MKRYVYKHLLVRGLIGRRYGTLVLVASLIVALIPTQRTYAQEVSTTIVTIQDDPDCTLEPLTLRSHIKTYAYDLSDWGPTVKEETEEKTPKFPLQDPRYVLINHSLTSNGGWHNSRATASIHGEGVVTTLGNNGFGGLVDLGALIVRGQLHNEGVLEATGDGASEAYLTAEARSTLAAISGVPGPILVAVSPIAKQQSISGINQLGGDASFFINGQKHLPHTEAHSIFILHTEALNFELVATVNGSVRAHPDEPHSLVGSSATSFVAALPCRPPAFAVYLSDDGGIGLSWLRRCKERTTLFRSPAPGEPFEEITRTPICITSLASAQRSAGGTEYEEISFTDSDGDASSLYLLEIDYPDGTSEIYGPTAPFGPDSVLEDLTVAPPVQIVSFDGALAAGEISLTWETANEADLDGFNLYRTTSVEEAETLLPNTPIAAEGNDATGATYSYVDMPGSGVFYYRLEGIDSSGQTQTLGIVKVGTPSALTVVADAGGPYSVPEGGSVVLEASAISDGNSPLSYAWDLDADGIFETPGQSATFSAVGLDGPDRHSVTVQVSDSDGNGDTSEAEVIIQNVAPPLEAISLDSATINESDAVTLDGRFTDPGDQDSHQVVIYWGDGSNETLNLSVGERNFDASHRYLDDDPSGTPSDSYAVTVTVTDDDGGSGSAGTSITVRNVAPDVTLDMSGSLSFGGSTFFLSSQDGSQSHTASATDPGADSLTFTWDFGPGSPVVHSVAYDGDPLPVTVTDSANIAFATPGVYQIAVAVADDDGGSNQRSLPKLVTGDQACVYGQGFWKHQFSGKGKRHVDETTLTAYLAVANAASTVFSESVSASTAGEAKTVMAAKGPDMRGKAQAHLLAAWLNIASGAVAWDQVIDIHGDGSETVLFNRLMAEAETILLAEAASHDDLVRAKDLAEAVSRDAGNEQCQASRAAIEAELGQESEAIQPPGLFLPLIERK